ncbi:hypothetical protein AcW1_007519 [Taiwanofungus camphoratus]|nr:hypothetical protein AcW1_007519 [Antrodia cinnamomea]
MTDQVRVRVTRDVCQSCLKGSFYAALYEREAMLFFTQLLSTTRLFCTSTAHQFPKLKSHSGTKKRWRSLPSGIFKRLAHMATQFLLC